MNRDKPLADHLFVDKPLAVVCARQARLRQVRHHCQSAQRAKPQVGKVAYLDRAVWEPCNQVHFIAHDFDMAAQGGHIDARFSVFAINGRRMETDKHLNSFSLPCGTP